MGLAIVIAGGFLLSVFVFYYFSKDLPSFDQITNRQIAESTKIYDRSGKFLLYEISNGQKRTTLAPDQIPQALKDATVSIEDQNFYNEPGFSIRGTIRAFFENLLHGRIVQGGSTITQQLARNAFLTTNQTITRKVKEVLLAIRLNRYYQKDEILNLYLNEVPYGPTLYGVEAASEGYFSKPAKDLTLRESAILASIPKAPSFYSPWGSHQKELLTRSTVVLNKMFELKKISDVQLKSALKENITFAPQSDGIRAPHFVLAVQDYLAQKYGEDMVRLGGLKVLTTLDWDLQQAAEAAVKNGAERNEKLYQGKNAALVSEDPKTGQILAMVGSRDYFDTTNEGNFNVATQGLRQPGSALKPFVYMDSFELGYAPSTILFDVPTNFNASGDPSKDYAPEDFDGLYRGPVSLKNALAQSVNIPAVKTLYLVGIKNVLSTLQDFGLTTLVDPKRYGLSLVLGGGEVRLIEMVNAYSVLAQDGIKHKQAMVMEVRDKNDKVLEAFGDQNSQVVSPQYPRLINDILSDVDARGPLYGASLNLTQVPNHDIALKTGTSNDYRDAWTFGYTPFLVTGVWAGNNNNAPMQRNGSSILAAVPIWHEFMAQALKDKNPEAFTRPDPVFPQKPILAGNYVIDDQVHSILYYVNPNNPTGPAPSNPESNPQFPNWEKGVLAWAKNNQSTILNSKNQSSAAPTSPVATNSVKPEITIKTPAAGDFITNQIVLSAAITSQTPLAEINIYLNNKLINKLTADLGSNYSLNYSFSSSELLQQNLLEIEAINRDNLKSRTGVIVYYQNNSQ